MENEKSKGEDQKPEICHEQWEEKLDRLWEELEKLKVKPPTISVNIT